MDKWYKPTISIVHDLTIIESKFGITTTEALKDNFIKNYDGSFNEKYKFLVSGYNISPLINGFDISSSIEDIKNTIFNDINVKKITVNNTFIHFSCGDYNFYYPNLYENIMIVIMSKLGMKIYSMNEYWIKNIIE